MREIMERVGAEWTEFPVELGARLDLDRLAREAERLRPKAITLVHNETSTGATYPAAEVGKIARSVGASTCSTRCRPSPASTCAPTSGAWT